MSLPEPTTIYHITHVSNLPSIINEGGLKPFLSMENNNLNYRNIAHHSIRLRRESTVVPCGPGGRLIDYVPFYFAPRSPMLYTIHRNNVEGYSEGQNPIVHLLSIAQAVGESGCEFVFTDGHATMELTEFFDELRHLDQIDWNVWSLDIGTIRTFIQTASGNDKQNFLCINFVHGN